MSMKDIFLTNEKFTAHLVDSYARIQSIRDSAILFVMLKRELK